MILWLLLACNRLKDASDLTDPVVIQGLYLGMDLPEGINLGNGDEDAGAFAYTSVCRTFVAYISGTSSLASAQVDELAIDFSADSLRRDLRFNEDDPGKYTISSVDGLLYNPGDDVSISTEVEGIPAIITGNSPEAPDYSISTLIAPNIDLSVDLSASDYDNLVVGVYDLDRGKLMWDNLPTEFTEVYTFTHPKHPIRQVTVPGTEAFPRTGTYIVGVAGMEIAPTRLFDGVNTTLSTFMAGQLSLRLISVR